MSSTCRLGAGTYSLSVERPSTPSSSQGVAADVSGVSDPSTPSPRCTWGWRIQTLLLPALDKAPSYQGSGSCC